MHNVSPTNFENSIRTTCTLLTDYRELTLYFNNLDTCGEIDDYLKNPRGHKQEKCKLDIIQGRSCSKSPRGSNLSEKRPHKVINVIYGGRSLGENGGYSHKVMMSTSMSKETGKRQLSEKDIYFYKEDQDKVMMHHKDPLVILWT